MMLLRTAAHTGATASCRSQLRPDPGSEAQRPTVCPTATGRAIVSTRREPAMPMATTESPAVERRTTARS
jgi:hypothetical protein